MAALKHAQPIINPIIGRTVDNQSETERVREREHKRHTRRGVTTISATRLCRLDGNGSCVDTSRDNRDTVRRHRCVSRAKLAAYLANGGPNGGMEGGWGREGGKIRGDRQRSSGLVTDRADVR